jgi:hypothetical protein
MKSWIQWRVSRPEHIDVHCPAYANREDRQLLDRKLHRPCMCAQNGGLAWVLSDDLHPIKIQSDATASA